MSKSPSIFIQHVFSEIAFLEGETENLSEDVFMRDQTLQHAFTRSLEIIGEAIKQVPNEFRKKYPEIEWRSYAGLRDKLIHHYFGVNYALVWKTVIHELPQLKEKLQLILSKEKRTS